MYPRDLSDIPDLPDDVLRQIWAERDADEGCSEVSDDDEENT